MPRGFRWSPPCSRSRSVSTPRTPRSLTLFAPLRDTDWVPGANGAKGHWRCAALQIPGARFVRLRHLRGGTVDATTYQIRRGSVHWRGGTESPPELEVEVELSRRLAARRTVAFALVLGVGLSGYATLAHPATVDRVAEGIKRMTAQVLSVAAERLG